MHPILHFKDITIGYSAHPIAQGLSCELNQGDILEVTGENGSGKTTLLKTILGEISPIKGSVINHCKNIYHLKQSYQEKIHIPLTALEILGELAYNLDFTPNTQWDSLSGGQKQQVLIHKACSKNIDLLILDEPFNHLDSKSTIQTMKLINEKLKENKKLSLIIVSHKSLQLIRPTQRLVL